MLLVKIDLNKVDMSKVFNAKSGAKYLDLCLIESKPSNFGDDRDDNTHFVVQSLSKADNEALKRAGKKSPILGSAKPSGGGQRQTERKLGQAVQQARETEQEPY